MSSHDVLTESEIADLVAALEDEYQARATYAQVIVDFGPVRPFSNIVDSEGRHIVALMGLFDRYGVTAPADTWPGRVPRFASVREACEAGVAAEVANAELYERLLAGTARTDVLEVYRNLRAASQERHLQAFRRCAARGSGPRYGDEDVARGGHGRRRRRRRHRGAG